MSTRGQVKNDNKLNNGFTDYNLKNNFIKNILNKSRFNDFIINHCLHQQEWQEYCRLKLYGHYIVKSPRSKASYDNHCHLVLYKGTQIVCAASIEFTQQSKPILQLLTMDKIHQTQ
ncbi:MAG: hypothetical protein EOP33_03435 [Rickettsiaceae bacterium]|nr:MAG: hypothetical protein EOP33_03435 [Rickettsiaceae bacterium]